MNDLNSYYLHTLGITQYQLRQPSFDQKSWNTLHDQVTNCRNCTLCETRTQVVFGVGDQRAQLMIVGEAPGFYEDQQGEPFVGRSGQLLNAMLQTIGLKRENIFICNILKCRPPNNRDPLPEEVAQCTHYLQQQIQLIKPKIILAVGRISAHYLLDTDTSLSALRGKMHQYTPTQTPLMVTYHPSYLLRKPADKSKAYKDLLVLAEALNLSL